MHLNLHTKVLISLIGLFIFSLASMGLVLVSDSDNRLEEFMLLQATAQARTLAKNSEDPLLIKDYPALENLVNVAKSEDQYAFAAIISPDGLVYSHSDITFVGDMMPIVKLNGGLTVREIRFFDRKAKEIIYPLSSGKEHIGNAHLAYYLDTESTMSSATVTWLFEILILTLVVLSLGGLFITKHFTRPIVKLTNLVNKNLTDDRLKIDETIMNSTDEVGALAHAFKGMSDQLVDRLEELEVQIMERDIAQAANDTKSAFLANVSHELRTPLNAIIGFSEILHEDYKDSDSKENQDDLSKIIGSAKHLNSLIDDMLDLSKIEAGKLEVLPVEVDAHLIVEDVVSSVQPLLVKNNNALSVNSNADSVKVIADPFRLKQVLYNLLSNSAKFTRNGDINITVSSAADTVLFAISDTGIGMSDDQQKVIFEAFTQADSKTTQKYGGTGLGLAISLKLCKMMGGDLIVKSQSHKGSTFTVLMPSVNRLVQVVSA